MGSWAGAGSPGARPLGYLGQDQMLSAAMATALNPSRRDAMERSAFKIIHCLQMTFFKKGAIVFPPLSRKGSSALAQGRRIPPGTQHPPVPPWTLPALRTAHPHHRELHGRAPAQSQRSHLRATHQMPWGGGGGGGGRKQERKRECKISVSLISALTVKLISKVVNINSY